MASNTPSNVPASSTATHNVPAGPLEVDPALQETSDYETAESEYSTASLSESIRAYRYENGRRYHAFKDGKYTLPNDEAEQERLDIIHHIYLLMLDGKLVRAPVDKNIQRILDVGTGTGIWAIDAAENFPAAEVVGTDLSPIQPSWVPPNVSFQIDDAESDWTFARDSFDLIHIRHLNGGIRDWGKLIQQAFNHLKPGGWLDVAEYEFSLKSDDGTLPVKSNLFRFYELVNEAADKLGQEFKIAASLDRYILDAGFEKVNHEEMKLPLGTWPAEKKLKEMGAFLLLTTGNAFEAFGMALLTRTLGMSIPAVEELITSAKKESHSKKIHSYSHQHLYYAQKPFPQKAK